MGVINMKLLKVRPTMLKRWNFSMIEIMATIAIITILAGLSFGAYRGIQKGQAKAKTEATVNAIHVALQAFKTKNGYYPQATNPVALVFCKTYPTTGNVAVRNDARNIIDTVARLILGKDFVTFLGTEVMKNAALEDGQLNVTGRPRVHILVDAYKEPLIENTLLTNVKNAKKVSSFYYQCPGTNNQESYDLFSAGPDRKFGTNDDIWPQGLKRDPSNK